MKLEENKEAKVEQNGDEAQSPSRRKFLRTSSTTALITSLAAQPVWGQTCSGSAGSAASQAQDDSNCRIPSGVTGQAAEFWTQPLNEVQPLIVEQPEVNTPPPTRRGPGAPPGTRNSRAGSSQPTNSFAPISRFSTTNLDSFSYAFPSVKPSDATDLLLYVKEVMNSNSFTIPGTPTQIPQVFNVASAMNAWGSTRNLAAIWLNAYFGFFDTAPPGRPNTPQDWVEHFHALYELSGGNNTVFNAVFNRVATTAWTMPVYVETKPEPSTTPPPGRRRGPGAPPI